MRRAPVAFAEPANRMCPATVPARPHSSGQRPVFLAICAPSTERGHMWRDMERRAKRYSLDFTRPDIFPTNGLKAPRLMPAALDEDWCGSFANACSRLSLPKVTISRTTVCLWKCLGHARLIRTVGRRWRSKTGSSKNCAIACKRPAKRVSSARLVFWSEKSFSGGKDRLEDALAWAGRPTT